MGIRCELDIYFLNERIERIGNGMLNAWIAAEVLGKQRNIRLKKSRMSEDHRKDLVKTGVSQMRFNDKH